MGVMSLRICAYRRLILLLVSVTLTVVPLVGACGDDKYTVTQANPAKPNIVFILADDMRKDDLKYMPKTRSLLQDRGMSFQNAFVSNPLCCPSRATIMRGHFNVTAARCGWGASAELAVAVCFQRVASSALRTKRMAISPSITAKTRYTSAMPAFEMRCFSPSMTQPSPSWRAAPPGSASPSTACRP